MASPAGGEHAAAEELSRQVRALQSRVEAIEHHLGIGPEPEARQAALPVAAAADALPDTARLGALLGKAFVGLALAYLLRALAEMGTMPITAGAALGILYALGWLALAAREGAEPLTAGVRAATAALILAPLLWEAQMKFQALPSPVTAAVLAAFVVFGLAVSWQRDLASVAWIATLAGLLTTAALLVGTKDLLPYTWGLLAMAVAVEVSACFGHWLRERWAIALLADCAVLLLTFVITRPAGLPEGYAAFTPGAALAVLIALLGVYLASTFVRTLALGLPMTGFEVTQCILAFLISTSGAIQVSRGDPAAVLTVGLICTACGVACYVVSFAFLGRHAGTDHNLYLYSSFGLALVLAGTWLMLGALWRTVLWSLLAVVLVGVGRQAGRMTLKWHGTAYLLLAAFVSGAVPASAAYFLGAAGHGAAVPPSPATLVAAAAAAAAAVFILRNGGAAPAVLSMVSALVALLAGFELAGVAAGALLPLCHGLGLAVDFCPALLTALLAALLLGAAGAALRLRRRELMWVAYVMLAVASYKLVVQDIRAGHTLAVVFSLVLYGVTLLLLPRIAQKVKAAAA